MLLPFFFFFFKEEEEEETLGCDLILLLLKIFGTSGYLWRNHRGPQTAGMSTCRKHKSRTHVGETE